MNSISPITRLVFLLSLIATADRAGAQQTEAAKLFPPRPFHFGASFTGRAVDISGEWALVGDEAAGAGGQVYFFRRGSSGWGFGQPLRGPQSSRYGAAVTIDGATAAVGAWAWEFPDLRGRTFVYENSDGNWVQSQVLLPVPLELWSLFGFAVDLSADVLVVGAPGSDVPILDGGEVFIYERIDGTWTQVERLQQPPLPDLFNSNFKNLGACVAVDGDVMVAGAPGLTGAVYVYERGPGGWGRTALLQDPTPRKNDHFGSAVGVSGDRIVVGEPAHTGNPYRPGSAFVFEKDPGGSWVLQRELRASDGFATSDFGDIFGTSVDIDGDRIVVGMPRGKIQGVSTGTGYLFVRGDNGWPSTETKRLVAADSSGKGDLLGFDMAINGGFMIAGAIGAWVGDNRYGAAYVFEVELGQTYCDGNPNSTGVPARLTATGSLRVTDQDLTLSVRQCPKGSPGVFLMSSSRANLPMGDGVLCLGSPFRRLRPPLVTGAGGKAMIDLDFGDPSIAGSLLAGSTWTFQFWYLDRTAGPGSQNLSNALALTLK